MAVDYFQVKEKSVFGRYVTTEMLEASWLKNCSSCKVVEVGKSVNGKRIKSLTLGTGQKRFLMWSQMHGNESTTTKAVLDLVNFLHSDTPKANDFLTNCTFLIVPILNPDGAESYTRVNANAVDLNRDAKNLTQPESKVLRELFTRFKPDFCFNLHDQRTLFSVGNSDMPATVSFLCPASDIERRLTSSRKTAMKLIVAMDKKLQSLIPGQIGRYDDAFNDNCVGDSFQMTGVPTILFEAGHFPDDHEREKTRELIFYALLEVIGAISKDQIENFATEDYFKIPENKKLFFDVLVENAQVVNPNLEANTALGIRYKEVLQNASICFQPEIAETGFLKDYFGHKTYDCHQQEDFALLSAQKELLKLVLTMDK